MKRSFNITVTIETAGDNHWIHTHSLRNEELISLTPEKVESEISHRLHYLGKDLLSDTDGVTLTRVAVETA